MARHGLSGKEKAAIALIAMGPELSAEVFKHMREDEIEELTLEIASMRTVPPEQKDKILGELYHMYLAQEYIAQGGSIMRKRSWKGPWAARRRWR